MASLTGSNLRMVAFAAAAAALCASAAGTAWAKGGVVFGLDLGYGISSGDTNVLFKSVQGQYQGYTGCDKASPPDYCSDVSRTDAGGGGAAGLHLGYNVLGYGSLEAYIFGHGNKSSGKGKWEGVGHAGGMMRLFPLEFARLVDKGLNKTFSGRKYDVSFLGGYGMSYMGYHKDIDGDGTGWSGTHFLVGLGGAYEVTKGLFLGLDLRYTMPTYNEYIYNWDDDITLEPRSVPQASDFSTLFTVSFLTLGMNDE